MMIYKPYSLTGYGALRIIPCSLDTPGRRWMGGLTSRPSGTGEIVTNQEDLGV